MLAGNISQQYYTSYLMPNLFGLENDGKTPIKTNDQVEDKPVNGMKSFKSCAKAVKQQNRQKKDKSPVVEEKKEKVPVRVIVNREYEWLATLLERCSFIVFSFIFIILSFGINAIGLKQWQSS
jgi:hypothetical protein